MARIRTIKPKFFRHEALQDLEGANPGKYPMLVFAGLWGHCDKAGRFEWRPRMLKLDILPFLNFDMTETLNLLVASGFINRYSADGGEYGVIPSFGEHQRINGKESQEPEMYPAPEGTGGEESAKHPGSNGEAAETTGREGKGRGREKEEEGNGAPELALGAAAAVPVNGKHNLRQQASEIIAFLNEKAGRGFEAKGPNLDFVLARLKDGETVEDCRAVIALKVREWKGDAKAEKWLRPETLFNRTKFASYKGELAPH
jgi:uncharacterized phage protein (TIGR02220 family)